MSCAQSAEEGSISPPRRRGRPRKANTPAPFAGNPSSCELGRRGSPGPKVEEVELADNPEVFREIFGDCEFPVSQIRKLMAAVAKIFVDDYQNDPALRKTPESQRQQTELREAAKKYIFGRSRKNRHYVFGFDSVCHTMGIDPEFARKAILDRERARDEAKTEIAE